MLSIHTCGILLLADVLLIVAFTGKMVLRSIITLLGARTFLECIRSNWRNSVTSQTSADSLANHKHCRFMERS